MNADPRGHGALLRLRASDESDALVDRIEAQFDDVGYGLWAVEVKGTGQFIGFTGLAVQTFPAHFTPAVEVGWRAGLGRPGPRLRHRGRSTKRLRQGGRRPRPRSSPSPPPATSGRSGSQWSASA